MNIVTETADPRTPAIGRPGADSLDAIRTPTPLMRPAGFWAWNDKLEEPELRRQIREMAQKGWGSFFIHPTVGLVTEYLSGEFMSLVKASIDEAERNDISFWIYDEDTWPSGFAGGLVPSKSEAYRIKWLVLLPTGRRTTYDTVLAEVCHHGAHYEICRRIASLGNPLFKGTCYVDLMNPDAVREFIELTFGPYARSCGNKFGKSVLGVFTDEPSYANRWGTEQDVVVVPWSDGFPGFFQETKGYDILGKLDELFFDRGDYRKTRFDFYDSATQLFKQSFTRQYAQWCEAHGLLLTGHFLDEDSLRTQTAMTGDVMTHYECMHWPGIDKLYRGVRRENGGANAGIVTIKQLTSVTSQLGKDRALSEAFSGIGGQVSFFHRKWLGDWQAVLGINAMTNTMSWYSMRGERKRNYPVNLFWQQPWWDDEKGLADYQARVFAAISQGEQLVDVLVIQPLTSVWTEYSPLHAASGFAPESAHDLPFDHLSQRLMEEKLDFHYGNESLMAQHGSVEGNGIRVGQLTYRCVILPRALNLRSSTVVLLRKFVERGGTLIVIGEPPALLDGVEAEVSLGGAIPALTVDQAVALASDLLPRRVSVIDTLTGQNSPSVFVHARRTDHSIRYFVANTDAKREVRARIRLPDAGEKPVAIFDLYDGRLYALDAARADFDVTLAPAGSLLAIVGEEAQLAKDPAPAVLGSGASFIHFAKAAPTLLLQTMNCHVQEENVLLLNDFVLEVEGAAPYRGPVCGAWRTRFYPAADGTPFRATYTFLSEHDVDDCFAVLEVAENLDSIHFNGVRVEPRKRRGESSVFDPARSWKDTSFTKVPLPTISSGVNVLVIEGRKVNNIAGDRSRTPRDPHDHRPTEAEEAYICGRFCVKRLSDGVHAMTREVAPIGRNLTKEGYPFYCGRVRYRAAFELGAHAGKAIFLKLNGLEAASAAIRVNDRLCGVFRWKPFVLEITGAVVEGQNLLDLDLAPTLVNCFGPNRRIGVKDELFVAQQSFPDMSRYADSYELFDFGLDSIGIYVAPCSER